ncbi:3-oxoacyl-acyl-carrier-protein synthase 3 [Candidatus Cyrtobacter comes]|uniref:Beta-ketoacyl-[acyl-carrier-protein] synthase III n=1 Tax=Candidatus Cyrtobacter comes TaxID=675776 RepID=A0ABU5L8Z7_9RICK|nr:beta-ketoacyl-ACP synthase III [Candidatus Cyrtobacter comes]MDZ5762596.1 3-oxoacyl-acyl-carrier-protein synthase 3 [Candidatus Cyrtobacter comes]
MSVVISGIGGYLPEKVLTNYDLSSFIDTSNEWILSRTGIEKRHILSDGQATSDMATAALKSAASSANIDPKELDGIIVATSTPDLIMPSTAVIVQKKIKASIKCFAFDIQAACAGFLYAIELGFSMMNSGKYNHIAIVGADAMSKIINWEDRATCVLFGDGAGALILSRSEQHDRGLICSKIYSDPDLIDILKVDGGVSSGSFNSKLYMQGPAVFKNAVDKLSSSMLEVVSLSGLHINDIDLIVPHQANQRITDSVLRVLGVPAHKVISTVSEHANTSAASIPLALHSRKKDVKDQTILFAAIGAGMTWGACIIKT